MRVQRSSVFVPKRIDKVGIWSSDTAQGYIYEDLIVASNARLGVVVPNVASFLQRRTVFSYPSRQCKRGKYGVDQSRSKAVPTYEVLGRPLKICKPGVTQEVWRVPS